MGYKGSVAIISGASKGIGAAIAVELAKKGLNVIIN
ncbi:SDR family NAD(P)-dependent oxidoreductase, partial [Desulfurella multipotens]